MGDVVKFETREERALRRVLAIVRHAAGGMRQKDGAKLVAALEDAFDRLEREVIEGAAS